MNSTDKNENTHPTRMNSQWKTFGSFVQKEFYHVTRDQTTLALLLILPVLLMILFGFSINTEVKNSQIAIYDPSNDVATRGIIEKIKASDYFTVVRMLNNPAEIEKQFLKDDLKMVVIFSDHFYENMQRTGKAQIELLTDGTDPNSAMTVVSYASNIIGLYQQDLFKIQQIPFEITPSVKLMYNPELKGPYFFVPGILGMILMIICSMMTSISIAREKEFGTMEVLLVSPFKPMSIILSKTVPYFVISLVNLATMLLLSVFMLKVPIAGSLFWLVTFSILFIFLSLSLGLLISSIANSQLQALLFSGMVLVIPVVMLSGMIFPIENMPAFFQWFSKLIPATWYISGVKKIMIKGLGFTSILPELGVLISMTILLIGISWKTFKYRLE
ncbi:MAG: drug efflux transport system permease protein [Bacteroidota bacterium]|nr:drug efflux transport system permease protein [Bacteroidota bacterium]MDK2838291.1 drug efflux transport system permease protein [Bacteroidota bacterium]